MKQKLLLILMLVSFCSGVFAQGSATRNGTIVVTDMNSIFSTRGTGSARMSNAGTMNVERLKVLVDQVQSSVYYYSGEAKTYGDVPTNLYTDIGSLGQLNNSITSKQSIEIVTININTASEVNSTIDLAAFSNFPNLKYIYFVSSQNTTSENIANHIVNYDNRFNLFYKIAKGDSRNQ
ncbi:MAG TPA: hypothetical protein PKN96_03415 [Flavobacterium sp.]|uniref:hypothetical protein n=1 Tax=Flavobacterium sp. TaxID=239 RepID=UPI002C4DC8B8|nr:hypothetical protein [Flavobacterium sp.]HNP32320.1 hypothetical protein [Flavobacterium sp.]